MIRYLIKNNFKLMSRSVTNVLLFIITPLILVALLSSAFSSMMSRYEGNENITAGYRIEGDAPAQMIDAFIEGAKENGITLNEYPAGDPEDVIKDNDMGGFVVFEGDSYTIYQNNDYKEEAKILEYAVNAFFENISAMRAGIDTEAAEIKLKQPPYMEPIESTDYYGIIEVVYFGWCAIVCGAGIFINEKKYKIEKKLRVSNLSETKLYLAKFVPILSVVFISNVIAGVLTVVLFDVHWGNPALSALIILTSSAAATALGLMVYIICDNMVVTIIGVFTIVWISGFLGGSFETYIFSAQPMHLKMMSPIYHINKALVELSCMGHSDSVPTAILYCLGILIVCSTVAVAAASIKHRRKV